MFLSELVPCTEQRLIFSSFSHRALHKADTGFGRYCLGIQINSSMVFNRCQKRFIHVRNLFFYHTSKSFVFHPIRHIKPTTKKVDPRKKSIYSEKWLYFPQEIKPVRHSAFLGPIKLHGMPISRFNWCQK